MRTLNAAFLWGGCCRSTGRRSMPSPASCSVKILFFSSSSAGSRRPSRAAAARRPAHAAGLENLSADLAGLGLPDLGLSDADEVCDAEAICRGIFASALMSGFVSPVKAEAWQSDQSLGLLAQGERRKPLSDGEIDFQFKSSLKDGDELNGDNFRLHDLMDC